jgi:hypothetical protein
VAKKINKRHNLEFQGENRMEMSPVLGDEKEEEEGEEGEEAKSMERKEDDKE